jgi:hypothetical protein
MSEAKGVEGSHIMLRRRVDCFAIRELAHGDTVKGGRTSKAGDTSEVPDPVLVNLRRDSWGEKYSTSIWCHYHEKHGYSPEITMKPNFWELQRQHPDRHVVQTHDSRTRTRHERVKMNWLSDPKTRNFENRRPEHGAATKSINGK